MMQKIRDFIFQDVENPNETKTAAVTLRLHALLLCLYFVFLFITYMAIGTLSSAFLSVVCCVLYILAFGITYLNRTHFASFFSQALMVLWIALFIRTFGWDCGVQHFLFVLLVLNFTVSSHRIRSKIFVAVCACAYRLLLYAYTRQHLPVSPLPVSMSIWMQIINTVFIFAELTTIMIIFTQNSQQMESKLVHYNAELEHIASTDPLTGLDNRWQMCKYLEKSISDHDAHKIQHLTVAMGDIDFFKRVNDTYGHDAGDEVLKTLAKLFRSVLEPKGHISRWGGEEFLFVFYDIDSEEAKALLTELLDRIRHTPVLHGRELINVTMTFGIEEYDRDHSMDSVISEADRKLYLGKTSGRNQIIN